MKPIDFEQALSTLFREDDGGSLFLWLAFAQLGGFANRVPEWLKSNPDGSMRTSFEAGAFAEQCIEKILPFWRSILAGDRTDILDAIGRIDTNLAHCVENLIIPLTILERGPIVVALYNHLLENDDVDLSAKAVMALAQFGAWDEAIAILERAHLDNRSPSYSVGTQGLLWKHAYLQGQVDTVMPKLASIPFDREHPHQKDSRAWQLLAYQILVGRDDVCAPVIEQRDQTHGYVEAAVMQIAALADDPSEARAVAELRRVTKPPHRTIQYPQRGIVFEWTNFSHELFKAEVKITARRRDYARAKALARASSHHSMFTAPGLVINAFLDLGDWRGAADIAQEHDPRYQPIIDGFDDTRSLEYIELQRVLAAAAARAGAHAAAHLFLDNWANAELPLSDEQELQRTIPHWILTTYAGGAEGALSPRALAVLLPAFMDPF